MLNPADPHGEQKLTLSHSHTLTLSHTHSHTLTLSHSHHPNGEQKQPLLVRIEQKQVLEGP